MINGIRLSNFKGLKNVELRLKQINILVGENGTGKSSILHALSVLKQSSYGSRQVVLNLQYTNLGGYQDVLGDAKECDITIEGSTMFDSGDLFGKVNASYTCYLAFDIRGMLAYKAEVSVPTLPKITNSYHIYGGSEIQPNQLSFHRGTFNLDVSDQVGIVFASRGYSYSHAVTAGEKKIMQDTYLNVQELGALIHTVLQRIFIVPVIRGLVEPFYGLLDQASKEVMAGPGLREMGASFSSNLVYNKKLQKKISDLAEKVAGVRIEVDILAGRQVAIKNPLKNTNMVNEGFGSNQLLFILERLVNAENDSLIGIEEPEIHLHPKAQWELADLICEIAKSENKQVIITTHSEHVVYSILNRISKKVLTPEDVALYNFELDEKTSLIKVTEKKIDMRGRVEGGIKGFIEANLKALDEYISGGHD